jgi:UDP:flavonoid glycosyltransferase YjiC (YdhE family)
MWRTLKVDIVTAPFAGHLFPLLELATSLRSAGMGSLRFLSTVDAQRFIEVSGFPAVALIPGKEGVVQSIANPGRYIGSNPLRLIEQFRKNLTLMGDLAAQLRDLWTQRRPDLALVDFTVPIAGLTAQALGIPWWTGTASPCAIETRTGTPSHMGGWRPRADWLGRLRDRGGRLVHRIFKRSVARMFANELRALGITNIYRNDGCEIVYSPERILAYGMREFEFERDWPPALQFIGPLSGGPPLPHTPPEFMPGKRHVLVSLGTHVAWAKQLAIKRLEAIAPQLSDCVFHFTFGVPAATNSARRGNVHHYGYFPYDCYLPRYYAAITHGGTGIVYSCIKAGVPMVVWPQDFDQFDHAARIVERGLGVLLRPRDEQLVADLRHVLENAALRQRVGEFQMLAKAYDPAAEVIRALGELSLRSSSVNRCKPFLQ